MSSSNSTFRVSCICTFFTAMSISAFPALAGGVFMDCDGDGFSDGLELLTGMAQDCNGNGIPDNCEIKDGTSLDTNGDGIPDECQDCDGDGIVDEFVIADCDGSLECSDCNGNGIPDGCDLDSGASPDVDGNGVPDECQADCNNNGVPDVEDIASGTSVDTTGNGVPDECDFAPRYTLLDLGTLTERESFALGLSPNGRVCGSAHITGIVGMFDPPVPAEPFIVHGFSWEDGIISELEALDLPAPPCSPLACDSVAFDINDEGVAVGLSAGGQFFATVWLPEPMGDLAAGIHELPYPRGFDSGRALAINNNNQIAGYITAGSILSGLHAAMWEFDGSSFVVTDLGTLTGTGAASAYDINERGQITGTSQDAGGAVRTFLWLPEPAYGLPAGMNNIAPTLPALTLGGAAINDLGQVFAGSPPSPFLWLPEAVGDLPAGVNLISLPSAEPGQFTAVNVSDINNEMQLAATITIQISPPSPGLASAAATWIDGTWFYLDDLLVTDDPWTIRNGDGFGKVNNAGQLSASADNPELFVITPVISPTHAIRLDPISPGDLDGDGVIGPADLAQLLGAWGPCDEPSSCPADLNFDGTVNAADLAILLGSWG